MNRYPPPLAVLRDFSARLSSREQKDGAAEDLKVATTRRNGVGGGAIYIRTRVRSREYKFDYDFRTAVYKLTNETQKRPRRSLPLTKMS